MSADTRPAPDAIPRASGAPASVVAGVLLVVLAAVVLREAFAVPVGRDLISGPRLFPVVITVIFAGLAVTYLAHEVIALARRRDTDAEPLGDVVKVVAMVALLVGYAFVLEPIGYILSTFVLFVTGAFLLGSRSWKRDVVVGVGLSFGIFVVFTQLLSVHLPSGVIPLG